jgi:hypothetical protein
MKKILLCLFLLIGLTISAKNLVVHDSNFVTQFKKEDTLLFTSVENTCTLNVTIASTLDIPTSEFFVIEEALNGTAPYTYLLDGNPSPNESLFYALTLNVGTHTVIVQDANGCIGMGTFYVSGLLTSDFVLPNFEFYPNPVKTILTISNTSIIDEIVFISIKGDKLLTKQINNLYSEIDLSNFSKGIYFLKIKAEGKEKTIKFIKE